MDEIKDRLKKIILEIYGIEVEPNVTEAPKDFDADYSTNLAMALCNRVGNTLRQKSQILAITF